MKNIQKTKNKELKYKRIISYLSMVIGALVGLSISLAIILSGLK